GHAHRPSRGHLTRRDDGPRAAGPRALWPASRVRPGHRGRPRMSLGIPLMTVRSQLADFVSTLIYVYLLVIFAYIVSTWIFGMGLRIPYYRYTDTILGFLHAVTEPSLRIFPRILPRFGPPDLSPIVGIIV